MQMRGLNTCNSKCSEVLVGSKWCRREGPRATSRVLAGFRAGRMRFFDWLCWKWSKSQHLSPKQDLQHISFFQQGVMQLAWQAERGHEHSFLLGELNMHCVLHPGFWSTTIVFDLRRCCSKVSHLAICDVDLWENARNCVASTRVFDQS